MHESAPTSKSPFRKEAVDEALTGWVLVLKDLLKRTATVLDEAEPMKLTIRHMYATVGESKPMRGGSEGHRTSPIHWSGLLDLVAQYIDRLQELHVRIRTELLILEILLLNIGYEAAMAAHYGLSRPAPRQPHRPAGADPIDDDEYAQAIAVLFDTSPSDHHAFLSEAEAPEPLREDLVLWIRELAGSSPDARNHPGHHDEQDWRWSVCWAASVAWSRAEARVTDRVASYRIGASPENEDYPANRIHRDLMHQTNRFGRELERALELHRRVASAMRQRSSLLPPWFPRIPRFHRRGRSESERVLWELLGDIVRLVEDFVSTHLVSQISDLQYEVVYDYTMTASLAELPSTSDVAGPRPVLFSVPFVYLDIPRYFINVAHEVAHVVLPRGTVARVVGASPKDAGDEIRTRGWKPRRAVALRAAAVKLDRLYEAHAVRESNGDQLIEEALVDYIALQTVGPHYALSLLAAVLHVVRMPEADSRLNPVLLNPMTRVAALVQYETKRWVDASDAAPRRIPGWDPRTLQAVRAVVDAYFRAFEDDGAEDGWSDNAELARIWRQEARVLATMFEHLDDRKHSNPVQLYRSGGLPELARDFLEPQESDLGGLWITSASRDPVRRQLSRSAELRQNALNLVWARTLEAFRDHLRAHQELQSQGQAEQAGRELRLAIWRRESEVRPLLELVTQQSWWRGPVVTLYSIDAFWRDGATRSTKRPVPVPPAWSNPSQLATIPGAQGPASATISLPEPPRLAEPARPFEPVHRMSWMVGHYDVHVLTNRFSEYDERMDLPHRPHRGAISLRDDEASFFIRTEDFVVVGSGLAPESQESSRVSCFVRRHRLSDSDVRQPLVRLRSFGWVHWAEEYSIDELATIAELSKLQGIASIGVLYNGRATLEEFERGVETLRGLDHLDGPTTPGLAARLRVMHDSNDDFAEASKLVAELNGEIRRLDEADPPIVLELHVATDLQRLELWVGLKRKGKGDAEAAMQVYGYVAGAVAYLVRAHDVQTTLALHGAW